jgi:transcriptional regulator with XRE-family HTH domain
MAPERLPDAAEALLQTMAHQSPRVPGERLTATQEALILEASRAGLTQEQIAAQIGCHQSTVSRTLATYDDSRPLARKYLEAQALALTRRFVEEAKPEAVLRMLAKLDVVRDDAAPGPVAAIRVVVGTVDAPAGPDPFNDLPTVRSG